MNTTTPLGDRLTLTVFDTPTGVTAQLLIIDPQLGDVMLATFDGKTQDAVQCLAGAYLRELGRQVDGVPTVTGVFVRNDALVTDDEARRELGETVVEEPWMGDRERWDILKVMVEFEHEPRPRPMRVVHSTHVIHEQFGENIDSGHYGHHTWFVDPVSKRWREARAASPDDEVLEEHRAAVVARRANENVPTRARVGAARAVRRSRSRAKRSR